MFTGTTLLGPLNALVAIAPWSQNVVALLPGLAGVMMGRNPNGAVPELRRQAEPVARDRVTLALLLGGFALAWALRLIHVINGWEFAGIAALVAVGTIAYTAARQQTPAAADVPVEWRGVRRPWQPDDEEVLARGIAGG
jgi:branched-chain amino acid transport system permease protein